MVDRNPDMPPPEQPPRQDEPARRTAAPLLWIVLLLALLAFGWFIYSQRAGMEVAPDAAPPPPVQIGDGQDAPAERERAADDARRAARDQEAGTADSPRRGRDPARERRPDREAAPGASGAEYPLDATHQRGGTVMVGDRSTHWRRRVQGGLRAAVRAMDAPR